MIDIANELLLGKAREGFEGRGVYLMPKCVYELGGGSGPSYIDELVSGVSPLTLTNALADGLNYVKAFGGCEQRNIPEQYTQVNYVTNTAQTRVDTGLKFDFSKNYEIEYRGRAVTGSWYVLQARDSTSSNISGISGSNGNGNIILAFNGGQTATTSLTRGVLRADHIWYIKGTINNGNLTLYVKDETTNEEETVTGTYSISTPALSATIGLLGNFAESTTPQLVGINNDVYMARIKEDGVTIMNYIPARQLATAGFYDTISGTFKTAETPENLVADGNTVPTPDAPMDIWCNNGTLKAKHKSGLPLGYTKVEYLEATGTQYIDTGYALTTDNFEIYGTGIKRSNNGIFFGARNTTSPYVGVLESRTSSGLISFWTGVAWAYFVASTNEKYDFKIACSTDLSCKVSCSGFIDKTFTAIQTYVNGSNINLFGNNPLTSVNSSVVLYAFSIKDNGVLVRNFVPVKRNSDNELGMYDFVSGQFFTNQGTGSFSAGDPVSDPIEIYTDGTVETVEDSIGNTATCENLLSVGDYTDVQEILSGDITRKVGVKVLDGTESWTVVNGTYSYFRTNDIVDCITDSDLYCNNFVRAVIGVGTNNQGIRLYRDSNTSALFLRYDNLYSATTENIPLLKQYLADQYNAGTPVIIVYPLATETTETVTAQTLTTEEGDNTLTITQASISGLTMEASYKKKV